MKETAIKKINSFGKIGCIITNIAKVFLVLGMALLIGFGIFCVDTPQVNTPRIPPPSSTKPEREFILKHFVFILLHYCNAKDTQKACKSNCFLWNVS